MIVCGNNESSQLGEKSNYKHSDGEHAISPPRPSHIDATNLLSFSSFNDHTVWINENSEAFALGDNSYDQISQTLPKEELSKDTEIVILDGNGNKCSFISAVCSNNYSLYLVIGPQISSCPKLICSYFTSDTEKLFLNIGERNPQALFGGYSTSAAIDDCGAVIIITKNFFSLPTNEIHANYLPDDDYATKVAPCDEYVIALSSKGRIYEFSLSDPANSKFLPIPEIEGKMIVDISGSSGHVFAVTDDGLVYGRGCNEHSQIGISSEESDFIEKFTLIESLHNRQIIGCYAGVNHSLFRTSDNRLIGCGSNSSGQLLSKDGPSKSDIFPPIEIDLDEEVTFSVCGNDTTVIFGESVGVPANMPNGVYEVPAFRTVATNTTSELEDEVKKLRAENESLHNKVNEADKRIAELERELSDKTSILKAVEDELEPKNIMLEELSDALKLKDMQLEDDNETIKRLQIELKRKEARIEEDTKTIVKLREEVDRLRKSGNGEGGVRQALENRKWREAIEILDPATVEDLDKIKPLGGESRVFEVLPKARLILKLYGRTTNFDLREFFTKYEVANKLAHPNVVETFAFCMGNSKYEPFILLEHCPSNLRRRLKKLDDDKKKSILIEVAQAVRALHAAGFAHGDLKLDNVLLDSENHAKVTDFGGFALKKSDKKKRKSEAFIAPEVRRGAALETDLMAADAFAFGVIARVVLQAGGEEGERGVTEFARELVERCTASDRTKRPSFDEICEMLEKNGEMLVEGSG